MQIALAVKNIFKKFADFSAVNDVTFDVEDGKFFSILGPSGCGKTTLLRMIAGFYEPSGGQKQRVAIARCLVLEPTVLLLDEPLGALDFKLREQMKVELKKLQAQVGTTFVYITHDQSEALVMSDFVAVMKAGHFEQLDTPRNLYNNPSSAFVAQFVGDNNKFVVKLKKDESGNFFGGTDDGYEFTLATQYDLEGDNLFQMYVRPEAIIINPAETRKNLNVLNVEVKALLFDGGNSRILVVPENSGRELIVSTAKPAV